MLEWRLKAYRHWVKLNYEAPKWAMVQHPPIDFQDIIYYAAPSSQQNGPKSLDEVDPELLQAFDKLGIPLAEWEKLAGVAVDAVLDSVSVATTYQDMLGKGWHHLLPHQRGHPEAPRVGAEIPRLRGPPTPTTSTPA